MNKAKGSGIMFIPVQTWTMLGFRCKFLFIIVRVLLGRTNLLMELLSQGPTGQQIMPSSNELEAKRSASLGPGHFLWLTNVDFCA